MPICDEKSLGAQLIAATRAPAQRGFTALRYSLDSAVGLVLAAGTDHLFPAMVPYNTAALVGIAMAIILTSFALARRSPETDLIDR